MSRWNGFVIHISMKGRRLLGLLAAIFFFVTAVCQTAHSRPDSDLTELSLEQLPNIDVYGASKFAQKVTEAPSSVSIITRDDIKTFGYRPLADILKSLRSFSVGYDRNYSYLSVRGFGRSGDYNGRILVLVNGHRMNENVYDSVGLGTDFILDVDLIDRVEVIRGPSSSLYGSNAFFAVMNILTRSVQDLKGLELSGEARSYRSFKGRASYGNQIGSNTAILLSASGYESRGQNLYFRTFDDPATNKGIAHRQDRDRNRSVFGKFSHRDLSFEGVYITRAKHIPTSSYWTDFNATNLTTDDFGYMNLKYEHKFSDDFALLGRLGYNHYHYEGKWAYSGVENIDYGKGEWWNAELTATKVVAKTHKLTGGAEFQLNTR